MSAVEVNFDGLVGSIHNYGGLAHGNLAAAANQGLVSNPREAALQGLAKMRWMLARGLVQGCLPPHERPHVASLRRMGFSGSDREIIAQAGRASPLLLANVSSASAMWTANAATVSPSADTADKRVHLTPANLASHVHRAIETATTARILGAIFADPQHYVMHEPVAFPLFGDEGAANHCRLAPVHGAAGVEVFVWGREAFVREEGVRYPARQCLEASHIIATQHRLDGRTGGVVLARQSREAIDAGAFHNDVVAVSNGPVLLFHGSAFEDKAAVLEALRRACGLRGFEPVLIEADPQALSLREAVASYLFNSQIVTLPSGEMSLILPAEVVETPRASAFVEMILAGGGPIRSAQVFDLRQSMRNGGGPACLRLRVVLTSVELDALHGRGLLNEARIDALEAICRRHYRDRLSPADLADPALMDEGRIALDAIAGVLGLGSVYDFQQV